MWRLYVGAAKTLGRFAGPRFGDILLIGWRLWLGHRLARFGLFAFCITLAFSPLWMPAQMTPQERRQAERDRNRIENLERDVIGIKGELRQLQDLPRGQQAIREEIVGIKTLISERDKAFQWAIALLNAGALLSGGIWFLIRHRKPAQ